MQEQRLTLRLKTYWDMIRKDHENPDMAQFNPGVVEDLWPNCLKVSVAGEGKYLIYTYDYMGEPLIKLYGKDLTGHVVDRASSEFVGMVISAKLDDVSKQRKPVLDEGQFFNKTNKIIKYRSCLLPFANKKNKLTHIVVGFSCRVF